MRSWVVTHFIKSLIMPYVSLQTDLYSAIYIAR